MASFGRRFGSSREQEEEGLIRGNNYAARANGMLDNRVNEYVCMQQYVNCGVLTYTLHPFVIGRGHRMLVLDKLLKTLRAGGAEFCTMENAAAYDKRFPFGSQST